MAPRSWPTGAEESRTTVVMTDGRKSGWVATLLEHILLSPNPPKR